MRHTNKILLDENGEDRIVYDGKNDSDVIFITTGIQTWWNDYNQTLATCQLNNNGVIFLDDYDCPIDNQFEVDKLFEIFIIGDNSLAYNSRFYLSMKQLGFVDDYADFEKEAHNFIFMDDIYSLESVGRKYLIMLLKTEGIHNFETLEKYIYFKGIGEDLSLRKKAGFSKYGFVVCV
mgnify:CR=1 FL=1